MMLKDKVAVIYGAGGGVGGAVARAFASEGARLFLFLFGFPTALNEMSTQVGVALVELDVEQFALPAEPNPPEPPVTTATLPAKSG